VAEADGEGIRGGVDISGLAASAVLPLCRCSVWVSVLNLRSWADTSVITETKLAMASRHVAEGRRVVERQRALISSQRKAGLDTSASEKLLNLFESTQAIFEDDLRAAERNENSN